MRAGEVRCACGKRLHYRNKASRVAVEALVIELGEYVNITVPGHGTWRVQRHFIALHGIKAAELPGSAWEKVA